jgi:hypothetical protein
LTDLDLGARSLEAAHRLHAYVASHYLRQNGAIVGPDVGVRLNRRIWRFVKSYLSFLPRGDNYCYQQSQGYWVSANLRLHEITGNNHFLDIADNCAAEILRQETPEGCWVFPNPEWKGRIATVEGCFAALALLWTAERVGKQEYVDGARRWYEYLVGTMGFERYDGESLSINYFAGIPRGLIPNNATLAVWFFAEMWKATQDESYLEYCEPLVKFLQKVQFRSGELPYVVAGQGVPGRDHFLCYQYNAFQLMDLASYHGITGDSSVLPIIRGLGLYLSGGVTKEGFASKDCFQQKPITLYYTAAAAAALLEISDLNLGDYVHVARRAYGFLLSRQRKDGAYDFSLGDYGLLSDRTPYPKSQAMILDHLLRAVQSERKHGR